MKGSGQGPSGLLNGGKGGQAVVLVGEPRRRNLVSRGAERQRGTEEAKRKPSLALHASSIAVRGGAMVWTPAHGLGAIVRTVRLTGGPLTV
jgi:hypothetical protein